MSTSKLKFDNLEYIVMEGGGARGAAYLGAIRALEKEMQKRMAAPSSNIRLDCLPGKKIPALLDYVWDTGDRAGLPVIKGIAGSSAGAITTFALALGFNSDEIEGILRYPFKTFLLDTDAGVYRMVDADGRLAQGIHKRNKVTKNKELVFGRKFEFFFDQDYTPIGDVPGKRRLRAFIYGASFKIIIDGAVVNIKQLINFGSRLGNIDSPEDVPSFWRGLFRWAARPNNRLLQKIGFAKLLTELIYKVLLPKVAKAPLQFNPENVMAALSDAGMFSGFKVREFFMDMVILAATKDTQFHRGFVKLVEDKNVVGLMDYFGTGIVSGVRERNTKSISELLIKHGIAFKIGGRSGSKFKDEPKLDLTLSILSQLTFEHFNAITNINFGACVSNFTTGNPVYFGHEWTPDFRVMEAVAASMSIPPAIRPLYNLSDVVSADENKGVPFIDASGKFDVAQYYFYESVIKTALQKEIFEDDNTRGTVVNTNNAIDISAFLPKLRDIVNGEYEKLPSGEKQMKTPDLGKKTMVSVGGKDYIVDYPLYRYFYNSVYKGLFLDGGYRNNIPYNFFRLRNDNIDSVLAIKLDEHFPPPLMEAVYNKIKALLDKVETTEIIADIDLSELDIPEIESGAITAIINSTKPTTYTVTKEEIIRQTELVFQQYLQALEAQVENETDKKKKRELQRQLRQNKKPVKRLVKATIKTYHKKRLSPPWMQPVSILNTAFDGYGYGSEKGQVKQVTDHNQILPLYDYGIGTYDFDMDKVKPMIGLAQDEAEKATVNFFTN